jgi:hypothetical protein
MQLQSLGKVLGVVRARSIRMLLIFFDDTIRKGLRNRWAFFLNTNMSH